MSAGFVIDHSGRNVFAEIHSLLSSRLDRAAERLLRQTGENISRRDAATSGRSRPGEFPHTDQGRLARSLFAESAEPLTRRIGTDRPHGLWLEVGTRRMQPRPWLTRTLIELSPELGEIVTKPAAEGERA